MAGNYWRFVSAALLSGALLAGCGGGNDTAAPGSGTAPPPTGQVTTPTTPDAGTPSTGGASSPNTPGGTTTPPVTDTPPTTPPVTNPATGVATLQWNLPTEFTDGTVLPATVLAGFSVFHGEDASNMTLVAEVDAQATTLTLKDLAAGTHYFAVAAISSAGETGELSAVQSKTVM